MSGLIFIIIIFLIIGGIFHLALSAIKFSFKLGFWVLGLAFSIFGWLIKGGLLVLLGFLIVGVPLLLLLRRR